MHSAEAGDAAADVGDVEALEQALHDAVLAEGAVQRGKRDVGSRAGRRPGSARARRPS